MSRLDGRPLARLRVFCALVVSVAALAVTVPLAYGEDGEPPRGGPTRAPSATASLAGHPAGQGRPRPGRPTGTGGASEPGAADGRWEAVTRPSVSPSTSPSTSGRPSSGSASPSPGRSGSTSPEPESGRTDGAEEDGGTGDGRDPDGRDEGSGDDEELLPEDLDASQDTPLPSRTPPQDSTARERNSQAVSRSAVGPSPALTLGVGMALMGLGIGFLGVRLRRR
ncbi:hypothetical protein OG875_15900 [Streptomyces sp. NBC_01498]|uniref:hypothetical protein n=1 Tax=Streptomyces sp. NBC_01498 TaxID=2975870 RepID=UPI002E7B99A5|nr:hypothetical protein [Streptomyces sp. NBC_01498]WTL25956.1 hypothetical protein OG875_15900 [Streptomyces sp. NBC_01498]